MTAWQRLTRDSTASKIQLEIKDVLTQTPDLMECLDHVQVEHVPEPGIFCIDVALATKSGKRIALEEHGRHHYHMAAARDHRSGGKPQTAGSGSHGESVGVASADNK